MRFLMKVSFPVEAGNKAAKDGFSVIPKILEEQKPEAAYFVADGGTRTGMFIVNLENESDIPALAEPWFLAMNASVEFKPAMIAADLQKAAPSVAEAVKKYGSR
jgi:hypothetical protein